MTQLPPQATRNRPLVTASVFRAHDWGVVSERRISVPSSTSIHLRSEPSMKASHRSVARRGRTSLNPVTDPGNSTSTGSERQPEPAVSGSASALSVAAAAAAARASSSSRTAAATAPSPRPVSLGAASAHTTRRGPEVTALALSTRSGRPGGVTSTSLPVAGSNRPSRAVSAPSIHRT